MNRRRAAAAIGLTVLIGIGLYLLPQAGPKTTTVPLPSPRTTGGPTASTASGLPKGCAAVDPSLCAIDHVVFIVQENRSFDHYFGTYESPSGTPVNGIPTDPNGDWAKQACNPHPVLGKCLYPYHTKSDSQLGGPHGQRASVIDVNRGKMDGFIRGAASGPATEDCVLDPSTRACRPYVGPELQPDAMSYRERADIPNYWALADYGVLQDHLFASVDSYTLPSHMFIFSGWAASCSSGPSTCKSDATPDPNGNFNWTPIAKLLDEEHVDWGWYVAEDTNICREYPVCKQKEGDDYSPTNWNPPPGFNYIQDSGQLDHIRPVSDFREAVDTNTLPAVSWVIPSERDSEHPGKGSMKPGYRYVTDLINQIGGSDAWDHTAIFLYWDDWGGFYDHEKPITIDGLGYGIRVPGIMVSPYAKEAYVDHQVLSPDAFLKFIEDRFAGGKRLEPGQPWMMVGDARPSVREDEPLLGDVSQEFDFSQPPRDPPVLHD